MFDPAVAQPAHEGGIALGAACSQLPDAANHWPLRSSPAPSWARSNRYAMCTCQLTHALDRHGAAERAAQRDPQTMSRRCNMRDTEAVARDRANGSHQPANTHDTTH